MNSPQRAKIDEVLKRTSGRDVTSAEITLSYVFGAISGELTAQLFLLSGIAWILARVMRIRARPLPRTLLWIAIILAIAVGAIRYLAWQSLSERLLSDAFGVALTNDPFWLIASRLLLVSVPAGIGLGWLYIRRGLESAIIGSLTASVVGHAATMFVLARLY